jgi:hypothetical protein
MMTCFISHGSYRHSGVSLLSSAAMQRDAASTANSDNKACVALSGILSHAWFTRSSNVRHGMGGALRLNTVPSLKKYWD